jgi:hypothetical protein
MTRVLGFALFLSLAASLAPANASAQPFRYPVTCGRGCINWMISYFDHNPSGGISDWACGASTYNGHGGTDWPMSYGRTIVSAASGTVINSRDGCFDRCTRALINNGTCSNACTNLVNIRHDRGAAAQYLHMQRGSVQVGGGARVGCGTHIGNVASSGYSTGNHLHFGYWPAGTAMSSALRVDPFAGPCSGRPSMFLDQGPHAGVPSDRCYIDDDGDGSPQGEDCDDRDANRRPGRAEDCDGRENDCDAAIDEDVTRICGSDVGECEQGVETCLLGAFGACVGEVPAVSERCDTLDNDCDGEADDDRICEYDDAALAALLSHRASSDVDGDGRADACMRAPDGFECVIGDDEGPTHRFRGPAMTGAAWASPAAFGSVRMGDVDGDGRDDLCAREDDRVRCWGAGAEGFEATLVNLPIDLDAMDARSAQLWLADVDGDGRVDPCVRSSGGLRCQVAGEDAARTLSALSNEAGWGDVSRHGSLRFGDVNGDGRDDVCGRAEDGIRCWLADDVGFSEVRLGPSWSDADGWSEARYGSTLRIADVNGDTVGDVCGRGPSGFVCALGGMQDFDEALVRGPSLLGAEHDERASYATLRMGDVNGDRRDDLCVRVGEAFDCWIADADGQLDDRVNGPALPDADGFGDPLVYGSIRLADITGDGRADLCGRTGDGLSCWISDGRGFPERRRIPVWRDSDGAGDAAFASTLTIAGNVAGGPLEGGCGCIVGGRERPAGAWLFGLLGLALGARLSRRISRRRRA